MPTRSALDITDTVTQETQRTGTPMLGAAVGQQAAFVRALVDEVDRYHPEDRVVASLHDQLGDELIRLARMVEAALALREEALQDRKRVIDVLVVDDEEDALRASTAVLRALGYPCRTARSGEEALREFDREPAATVLADWSMPGMNGLELCAALKRREPRPYVLLATGHADGARLLDGVRGGADDFLRKPLDLDELEARLLSASRLLGALNVVTDLERRLRDARTGSEACARIALDRKIGGPLLGPSAYFMKSPPVQYRDEDAHRMVGEFAAGEA